MNIKKVLLFSACALLLFTGCGKKDSSTSSSSSQKAIKVHINETANLNIDYVIKGQDVILDIKNSGKDAIDYVNIDVALYNSKGTLIGVEKQYVRNLVAGKESVIKVYLNNSGDTKKDIAKVDVALNKVNYETKVETSYADKVSGKVEKTETDGQLALTINNESGETLNDLSAVVVFYKNSKIVDIYSISAQNVEATYTDTIYVPMADAGKNTSYIDYDEAKVIINNASKYNQ